MENGYESDSPGCSSLSEELMVLASAVSVASAFMSIMDTCANTGTDSNRTRSGTRGGSTPGKAGNRERSRVEGAARIDADYFRRGDTAERAPIFNEREFERRWAVPRAVYEVVREGVLAFSNFFQEKVDYCYALLRMRPLSISCAERCDVIS
jgi:hypothetical protein